MPFPLEKLYIEWVLTVYRLNSLKDLNTCGLASFIIQCCLFLFLRSNSASICFDFTIFTIQPFQGLSWLMVLIKLTFPEISIYLSLIFLKDIFICYKSDQFMFWKFIIQLTFSPINKYFDSSCIRSGSNRARDIAWWQDACLATVRSWVQSWYLSPKSSSYNSSLANFSLLLTFIFLFLQFYSF